MDFEPRESRLATIGKPILIGVGVVLLVALQIWRSHYASSFGFPFRPQKVSLPGRINTLAEGYPFAVKLKDRRASDATLAFASVTLRHEPDGFEPEMINYTFVSSAGKGRIATVMIMNERREAYLMVNQKRDFDPGALSAYKEQVLVPPPIDVPQIIEIANTNGLKQFFSRTDRESMVAMTLMNSTNGPFWQLIGISLDGKQIDLSIDAQTGAVLKESSKRDLQRPQVK